MHECVQIVTALFLPLAFYSICLIAIANCEMKVLIPKSKLDETSNNSSPLNETDFISGEKLEQDKNISSIDVISKC